jgi:hypothetical protein
VGARVVAETPVVHPVMAKRPERRMFTQDFLIILGAYNEFAAPAGPKGVIHYFVPRRRNPWSKSGNYPLVDIVCLPMENITRNGVGDVGNV